MGVLPDAPRLSTAELTLISQPKVVNISSDIFEDMFDRKKRRKSNFDYNQFRGNFGAQKRKLQSSVSWASNSVRNQDEEDEPRNKSLRKEEKRASSGH
ncbi:hypothetical protein AVEN_11657-1 [Araneus ventricosus]|uniref:Uncharacterized protein n=1 Tax=Araneus ventricosus TaxID=182803 RepID=A0A4Y2VE22_ARAVE|nr:hypothetical protein AVEN_11657-1 [Araneus ventricosus]